MIKLLSKTAQKHYEGASVLELLRASEKLTVKDKLIIDTVRETIKEYATDNLKTAFKANGTRAVGEYFKLLLQDSLQEELWVMLLDTKNNMIDCRMMFKGTLNSSIAHPREIMKLAVTHSARSIIISHNHPSGDLEPSSADLSFTHRLIQAGEILGIDVLDHIIVGDGYNSLRESTEVF